MKTIILVIIIICYLLFKLIKFSISIDIDVSNLLALISILVDIGMPLLIAYYLQNKFLIHRSLKSYHITHCDQILVEYKQFIDELSKGDYNRREISNKFKIFSIRFNSIDKNNNKRFKSNFKLQDINRRIQMLVTNSSCYNNTRTSAKVKLSNRLLADLYLEFENLLELNGDLIFELNK
jgi:hypothetical protein